MKVKNIYFIQAVAAVLLVILSITLLKQDFFPYMQWWLTLLILGILFMPTVHKIFSTFHDNGYLFSKTIGVAVSGYLMWLFSTLRIMKFNSFSCQAIVVICLIINIFFFYVMKKKEENPFPTDKVHSMITEELLFFAFFLLWTYIRGFKPEAYGTEKFMDYGFMNVMMRSDYMPPKDLWYAGSTINYYYVGQYMATYITKLSMVTVNVGYNFMLTSLASFGFVLPYSIIVNVVKNNHGKLTKEHKAAPHIAGILSGAGVSIAGNLHFSIYYFLMPQIRKLLGMESIKYWFPNSTRYIGYDPDTHDKTIHEFPSYSYVLGDLHAHVINIMFVITVMGILFAWILHRKKKMEESLYGDNYEEKLKNESLVNVIFHPAVLLIGFFIGLFHTTNFWDFPIYFVVAGAIILFSNAVVYQFKMKTLWITALHGGIVLAVAELIALPFTLKFDQISTQIMLTDSHSPLYQLLILWGLPTFLILVYFIDQIISYQKTRRKESDLLATRKEILNNGKKDMITNDINLNVHLTQGDKNKSDLKYNKLKKQTNNNNTIENKLILNDTSSRYRYLHGFLSHLNGSDLFILTLGLCAIGLVMMPEIIYIKDIYTGDYKRSNTMFKLTYQAFIMFGICSGYIFLKFINFSKKRWKRIFGIIALTLFVTTLWYSKVAIKSWYGNIFNIENYKGMDAAAFLETTLPDDYSAIKWINENIKGMPVMLEANGDSYSDYNRVSVFSGLPTVVGWYTHEWLWRGTNTVVDERAADIQAIYTSTDQNQVISLLDKYNVEYIYVGKLEKDKYTNLNHTLIKSLGEVIYSSPVTTDKDYETYIVQVEPKG